MIPMLESATGLIVKRSPSIGAMIHWKVDESANREDNGERENYLVSIAGFVKGGQVDVGRFWGQRGPGQAVPRVCPVCVCV